MTQDPCCIAHDLARALVRQEKLKADLVETERLVIDLAAALAPCVDPDGEVICVDVGGGPVLIDLCPSANDYGIPVALLQPVRPAFRLRFPEPEPEPEPTPEPIDDNEAYVVTHGAAELATALNDIDGESE